MTITADRFVDKGPGRPIFNQRERAAMIRAIAIVDTVDVCNGRSGLHMIRKYKPLIYVKHAEYQSGDPHGFLADERRLVESQGGKLVFWQGKKWSSSEIITRLSEKAAA